MRPEGCLAIIRIAPRDLRAKRFQFLGEHQVIEIAVEDDSHGELSLDCWFLWLWSRFAIGLVLGIFFSSALLLCFGLLFSDLLAGFSAVFPLLLFAQFL